MRGENNNARRRMANQERSYGDETTSVVGEQVAPAYCSLWLYVVGNGT